MLSGHPENQFPDAPFVVSLSDWPNDCAEARRAPRAGQAYCGRAPPAANRASRITGKPKKRPRTRRGQFDREETAKGNGRFPSTQFHNDGES